MKKNKNKQVKTYKENKAVKIRNKSYEWRRVNESKDLHVTLLSCFVCVCTLVSFF